MARIENDTFVFFNNKLETGNGIILNYDKYTKEYAIERTSNKESGTQTLHYAKENQIIPLFKCEQLKINKMYPILALSDDENSSINTWVIIDDIDVSHGIHIYDCRIVRIDAQHKQYAYGNKIRLTRGSFILKQEEQ